MASSRLSKPRPVGIIVNARKPSAAELLPKLRTWLEKRNVPVLDSLTTEREQVIRQSSMIICLGGDGTLLSVASQMRENSVPILGVNLGELGFLTEVKQEEVFEELEAYLEGRYQIEERLMLSCHAKSSRKSAKEAHYVSLNDMVISREGLSRLVYIEVRVNGEKLTSFSGDGVILATPTGSTAYSLSAGGSVVHPKLEAMIITPICPHASALRSIVVSADEKISVKIQTKGESRKALLTADGQENLEIDDSYTVTITRCPSHVKLIKSSKRSYFATLSEIFKFPV
ncbi:MAG: NAD(+)/NADH kinase [Candidatus Omnitrophica bacterium]|nr:NAD(+)/NADH kinase [Candidatus Omnitrophota bacterium]